MKVNDSKENILATIRERQVFDSDHFNKEKEQETIIQIAAEELHERLEEEYRKGSCCLSDDIWSRECDYITQITAEILKDNSIPMNLTTLKAKISNRENEITPRIIDI